MSQVSGGYAVGNSMTLADVDLLASYASLEACGFVTLEPYKQLKLWSHCMRQQLPKYADSCGKGAVVFGDFFNSNYRKD